MPGRILAWALAATWVVLLCVAVVLTFLAAANGTLPGDRAALEWLQDRPLPGQDLSDAVRAITGAEVVLAMGAALAVLLWLRGYRRLSGLLAVGLVVLAVAEPALKELVDRPRPDPRLVEVRAGYSSPSFPSGHAMSGAFLYGFLLYTSLRLPLARVAAIAVGAFAAAVILLSGVVNVWLGVHWPSDVVGGYVWSALLLLPLIGADRLRPNR